jgi:hypothetical protein
MSFVIALMAHGDCFPQCFIVSDIYSIATLQALLEALALVIVRPRGDQFQNCSNSGVHSLDIGGVVAVGDLHVPSKGFAKSNKDIATWFRFALLCECWGTCIWLGVGRFAGFVIHPWGPEESLLSCEHWRERAQTNAH